MGDEGKRRGMFDGVKRALWSDPAKRAMTEAMPIVDDAMAQRVIDLAMRVSEVMLSVGAPAKEVVLAALRISRAYGLKSVHVDVTYNSVTVSDHRNGTGSPITVMQVVRSSAPDHRKLQRLQQLVTDIEDGMPLNDAVGAFHAIRRTPFMYRAGVVVLVQALLAVSVALMFGASWVMLLAVLIAGFGVAIARLGLAHLRVPAFFSQVLGGVVLVSITAFIAWLGNAGIEPFVDVRSGLVVSAGIVLMLAGLAVVGAAQDAIDGFSLTAGGRILDLTVLTMGVVVGILIGLEAASHFGFGLVVPTEAMQLGSLAQQIAGATLVAVSVAIMNGGGMRIVLVSAGLGAIAWIVQDILVGPAGLPASAAVFGGALLASFIGSLVSDRLHVPSVAVTTAAIVPMVPGAVLFRGLLGVMGAGDDVSGFMAAFDSLWTAAMIAIALAAGATLGLFMGSPLRARIGGKRVALRSKPRVLAGAGTAAFEVVPSYIDEQTRPVTSADVISTLPIAAADQTPTVADTDDPHPLTKPYDPEEDER